MERIGAYICHCGTNIAGPVDMEEVRDFAPLLDGVAVARHCSYMCSDPGQELIKQDIKELGLTRVVVASCSPRMHEHTFRRACQEAGLNQFFFQMANIREQCSWVTEDRGRDTPGRRKTDMSEEEIKTFSDLQLNIKEEFIISSGGLRPAEAGARGTQSGGRCRR